MRCPDSTNCWRRERGVSAMEAITRDAFVAKFYISIHVRDLKLWGKRRKEPPHFLSTSIYETMHMCGTEFPFDAQAFARLVR